jgi:hypothetical protein
MKRGLRPVTSLGAAVLGLHLLALWHLPAPGRQAQAAPVQAVQARSIETAAASPPPAPQPVVQPLPAPAPVRKTMARVPTAMPSQEPQAAAREPLAQRAAATPQPTTAPGKPTPAVNFHVAPPQRLHYQIAASLRGVPVTAQGELQWRHDGGSYEARMEVNLPLLPRRLQHSAGRLTEAGLEPHRYAEKVRSEEAAHFERNKGRISFSSNRPQAALEAGAQDRLSLLLQLGAMVAGAPARYRPGSEITVAVAGTREAEPWLLTVEAEEELVLPGGTVKSLRIVRLARREFDQKLEIWLAPGMDYAPVRLRLTQPNGDWLDQLWSATDRG